MARIVGAIGSSHTPTIGFALDRGKQNDPEWAPIFSAYEPVREWLKDKKPDVLVVIYNDHVTSFFFDHYSAFALGIGTEYQPADEGGGARALPTIGGHAPLAAHIGASLVADEFDLAFFQGKPLDHGCFSPLSMLKERNEAWPTPIVPLAVGVLQFPIPTARRCYRLGQALRRAIESYPEDLSVVIVGTGGLSHQVHGERAGFNNPGWDARFLDLIEQDPASLTELTHAEYARRGGLEGSEVIMWLVMRGALSARLVRRHRSYYLPSMTGIATVVWDNEADAPSEEWLKNHRDKIARQLAGVEQLEGTYPFTLERSVKAFRLNRYLNRLIIPEHRQLFLSDPERSFSDFGLTEAEKSLLRARNWRGLIHYGCIFFGLEKLAAVLGIPNAAVYAAMRGQSLEEFQKTRNAPGALYSVAGTSAGEAC
ncbi:MAG: gallate dioxygenase [Steroidobacteraceae bacterium]